MVDSGSICNSIKKVWSQSLPASNVWPLFEDDPKQTGAIFKERIIALAIMRDMRHNLNENCSHSNRQGVPMTTSTQPQAAAPVAAPAQPVRLNSQDLLKQAKAVEIEHDGKIYELRLTRLNKLILTA
jgi:hemin uptake protein HemP